MDHKKNNYSEAKPIIVDTTLAHDQATNSVIDFRIQESLSHAQAQINKETQQKQAGLMQCVVIQLAEARTEPQLINSHSLQYHRPFLRIIYYYVTHPMQIYHKYCKKHAVSRTLQ